MRDVARQADAPGAMDDDQAFAAGPDGTPPAASVHVPRAHLTAVLDKAESVPLVLVSADGSHSLSKRMVAPEAVIWR